MLEGGLCRESERPIAVHSSIELNQGHIDPTATLRQQTPRQRAIEECKRVNWWSECEKMKPTGIEELSSDEEGGDEADEDAAKVNQTEMTAEEQAAIHAENKRKALAALAQTNLEVQTLKLMAKEKGHHFEIWAADGGYKEKLSPPPKHGEQY